MNPFRYGEVVTGPEFCERPELVSQLRACFEETRNCAVLGERRTGKTSLILETARRMRGLRLIHVQLWAIKSIDDLAQRLVDAVTSMERQQSGFLETVARSLGALRPRIELDPHTGQPSVVLSPGSRISHHGLQGVFDLIENLARRQRVAVLLDEFQDISYLEQSDAVLGAIRDRMQRQPAAPYVLAGSVRHAMNELVRGPSSPFFKSLRIIEVERISRRPFRSYLDRRFRSGGRLLSAATYDAIFSLAEDNPSDVQQFCAALWDRTNPGPVGPDDLGKALEHILASERKGYEALVRPLTDNQFRSLRTLARIGGQHPQSKRFLEESGIVLAGSVKRTLTRLVNLELVYGAEQSYKFYDPFFRQWILSRFS